MKAHALSLVVAMSFPAISSNAFSLANPEVWINEIHYDNTGGDAGEFFEIAGAAGIDLSNYFVHLMNGANGLSFDTVILSGTIDDEQNGFGAVSFLRSGIQNDRDGLALFRKGPGIVGTTATLLQFLSYEGTFMAVGHPSTASATPMDRMFNTAELAGKLSTDIGVSESGTTPIGHSLQLIGVGSQYGHFTWSGPAAASPGSLNSGQRIPAPAAAPDGGATFLLLGAGTLGVIAARRWLTLSER